MRYTPIYKEIKNKVKMNTSINNTGEINSSMLYKDGKEVLTCGDIAYSKEDVKGKIASIELISEILNNYNNQTNPFKKSILINDIQTLNKEKNEIHSKTDVLLDYNSTPEFIHSKYREELIRCLQLYDNKFDSLIVFMDFLMNEDFNDTEIIDEYVNKFNSMVDEYILSFTEVNRVIQLSIQSVMDIKQDKTIKIVNENLNQAITQMSYKLIITSETGPFFRKGQLDNYLYAKVYKSEEDVTDDYGDLQYRWKRSSCFPDKDSIWDMNAKRGKTLHITNSDYEVGGCSFICSLYDKDGRLITSSNM